MKKLSLLFILFIYLTKEICSTPELIASVEIFRHGARAPTVKYSENKNLYFGAKRSQLTINGFRQHILLGRWIRRRYIHGDVDDLLEELGDLLIFLKLPCLHQQHPELLL